LVLDDERLDRFPVGKLQGFDLERNVVLAADGEPIVSVQEDVLSLPHDQRIPAHLGEKASLHLG